MIVLSPEEIGGGRVRRTFKWGEAQMRSGDVIDAATLRAMPIANRNALMENRFIEVWPLPQGTTRHVVHRGKGNYDVIEGRKLNAEFLSEDEAKALAAGEK